MNRNITSGNNIVSWLFETSAIRVAPAEQPFWYTSGTLGPYYVNTHFLYGSQEAAEDLLVAIEKGVNDPLNMPAALSAKIMKQYEANEIFRSLMNMVLTRLTVEKFDYISGGERRDFFFSIPAAALLKKPHITILKDGRSMISTPGFEKTNWSKKGELEGKKVLHIADLVTQASSYLRTWIPVVKDLGATMDRTLVIVDRKQGGEQALSAEGTKLIALTAIDNNLFTRAVSAGLMTEEQKQQIDAFTDNPERYLKEFLISHPDFLRQQLASGGKNALRAQLCIDLGYGVK